MKKFVFEKGGPLHQLYQIGCIGTPGRSRKSGPISVWLFARRITLSVLFVLYASMLKLVGLCLTVVLLDVPVAVLTVLTNCVTIPLGIGVSAMYPEQKFLYMPFTMSLPSGKFSLAWAVIPFWVVLVFIWNASYGDTGSLATGVVIMVLLIALVVLVNAMNVAMMGEITVEFVDPPEEAQTTQA